MAGVIGEILSYLKIWDITNFWKLVSYLKVNLSSNDSILKKGVNQIIFSTWAFWHFSNKMAKKCLILTKRCDQTIQPTLDYEVSLERP